MISSPKKVWFHLAQWFQRGLIVKVYRGQRMPSCSNTSHDRYKSGTSYHARFQFAKWFQRRRLKSKSVQTTDAKGEQYVTEHLYSSFRVVIHLDDPLFLLHL
jgi:hypothetical protein